MKNTNKKTIIIAATTLLIGLLAGWFLFGGNTSTSHEDHELVKTEKDGEIIWTCSMHPQIQRNEPGDCPICGMELIPMESKSNQGEIDPMAIAMSPIAMQLAQVQTAVVGDDGDNQKSVRLDGKIQADERLVYIQTSHIPGRIEKLIVNFTGEYVSKGQVIAYLYSPALVTAQEELFEARKIKETQPALFNAAKEKLKNWKLTEQQIQKILNVDEAIEEFPLLANFSGFVTDRMVKLGDHVIEGQPIYEIADLSKVWILFDVYESDMNWIKKGASVDYTVQSIPGKSFEGKISYVDPAIDPKTRVVKARVETNNKDFLLKPEMFVSGTIKAQMQSSAKTISVPKTAVMWTGKRSVVYVMQMTSQGVSFMMREVTLGPKLGESYVIESGLKPGEEIAVNGTFSIDAAAQLVGKPSMMSPEGGVAMTGHAGMNMGGDQKKETSHSNRITLSAKTKEAFKPLFDTYFKLKDALVNDNLENALIYSKQMNSVLSKVNMNVFRGEAHNVWMKQRSILEKDLRIANKTNEIKKMRDSFKNISDQMVILIKTFGAIDQAVFVDYCPMADHDKGAEWLSTEKEIKNPYFGASMLTCGEVKQIIK